MTFRAIRAEKTDAGQVVKFVDMDESELMDGDVTIGVTHSTVNYKDGLALSGKSPVIRRFPMVLGVDLAGIVESSRRSDFAPGDEVVLTGYGLSETHFGGYAARARVNGDWLGQRPARLTPAASARWRSRCSPTRDGGSSPPRAARARRHTSKRSARTRSSSARRSAHRA